MRAYLQDMADLQATNAELVEANHMQCQMVADMRATVAQQVQIIVCMGGRVGGRVG